WSRAGCGPAGASVAGSSTAGRRSRRGCSRSRRPRWRTAEDQAMGAWVSSPAVPGTVMSPRRARAGARFGPHPQHHRPLTAGTDPWVVAPTDRADLAPVLGRPVAVPFADLEGQDLEIRQALAPACLDADGLVLEPRIGE